MSLALFLTPVNDVLGILFGVFLISVYLWVKSSRFQIVACLILVTVSEIFFSRLVPTFLVGVTASSLSMSTYIATLGQIPTVIRERESRYINLPMVCISIVNSLVWTAYAVLKKDIPLFMTNFLALIVMSVNLVFYLWAVEMIATETI